MNRHDRLAQLLRAAFPLAAFEIFDDSKAHAGHGHGFDGETHYRLIISDAGFQGLTPLQIHRKILSAIKPETDAGMHSFVIERAEAPVSP
jgi:BolA protein